MSTILKDGTGTGHTVKVDGNQRLHAQSITESEAQHATEVGRAYNINTGAIGLTSGSDSAILYVKNNENSDAVVTSIFVGVGSAATVDEVTFVTLIANPTGGTLISDQSAVDMRINRNFGSSLSVDSSLAYKGAEGKTVTGGTDAALLFQSEGGRLTASIDFVLPKGNSLAVKINPNVTAGTQQVYCALTLFLKDNESS